MTDEQATRLLELLWSIDDNLSKIAKSVQSVTTDGVEAAPEGWVRISGSVDTYRQQ